jgi:hypothetical protein
MCDIGEPVEQIHIVIVRHKGEYMYCKASDFRKHLIGLARKVDTARYPEDLNQEELAEALENSAIVISQLENQFP